jgi:glycyl-tRNA synthetase alpha subunit
MNPATFLRVLGPEPWNVCYPEPSVRPDDSRYGDNPNRVQRHTQFQVGRRARVPRTPAAALCARKSASPHPLAPASSAQARCRPPACHTPSRTQTPTHAPHTPQVILKPDPGNSQELYLGSLEALGIDTRAHDVRCAPGPCPLSRGTGELGRCAQAA